MMNAQCYFYEGIRYTSVPWEGEWKQKLATAYTAGNSKNGRERQLCGADSLFLLKKSERLWHE
jgi:hypothetical protein